MGRFVIEVPAVWIQVATERPPCRWNDRWPSPRFDTGINLGTFRATNARC